MKIIHEGKSKKLVAVIGVNGLGIFFQNDGNPGISYIGVDGSRYYEEKSLEALLKAGLRTPVYEGDKITLEF